MIGPFWPWGSGNMAPYTDFHALNTDWIIKIAKDFLDQYTHIEELIETGEETIENGITELNTKAEELLGALQAWYNEHSEDISTELSSAITAFSVAAEAKAAEAIATIPADYTTLATTVQKIMNMMIIQNNGLSEGFVPVLYDTESGGFGGTVGTQYTETTAQARSRWTDFFPINKFSFIRFHLDDYDTYKYYVIGLDDDNTIVWSTGFRTADATVAYTSLLALGATKVTMMISANNESGFTADETTWLHAFVSFRPASNANISYKRNLLTADDFDDITEPGIYYWPSSTSPAHAPFTTGGMLLVYGPGSGTCLTQWAVGYGADTNESHRVAHRELTGSTFSSWRYMQIDRSSDLAGKKFSILGDSWSAYNGYIPEGYAYHYPAGSVDDWSDMWWGELIRDTGMILDVNNSYSGSPLCDTTAFPDRPRGASDERTANLGTNPDFIFVMMGINDFNQYADPGTYNIGDPFPTTITTFSSALALALQKIQNNYPDARLCVCTIPEVFPARLAADASLNPFWTTEKGTIETLNNIIYEICPAFGAEIIDIREVFSPTTRDAWTHDGDSPAGFAYTFGAHPNHGGMIRLKDLILKHITK